MCQIMIFQVKFCQFLCKKMIALLMNIKSLLLLSIISVNVRNITYLADWNWSWWIINLLAVSMIRSTQSRSFEVHFTGRQSHFQRIVEGKDDLERLSNAGSFRYLAIMISNTITLSINVNIYYVVQGLSLQHAMSFFFKSKKRFTIEKCDLFHLKEF